MMDSFPAQVSFVPGLHTRWVFHGSSAVATLLNCVDPVCCCMLLWNAVRIWYFLPFCKWFLDVRNPSSPIPSQAGQLHHFQPFPVICHFQDPLFERGNFLDSNITGHRIGDAILSIFGCAIVVYHFIWITMLIFACLLGLPDRDSIPRKIPACSFWNISVTSASYASLGSWSKNPLPYEYGPRQKTETLVQCGPA